MSTYWQGYWDGVKDAEQNSEWNAQAKVLSLRVEAEDAKIREAEEQREKNDKVEQEEARRKMAYLKSQGGVMSNYERAYKEMDQALRNAKIEIAAGMPAGSLGKWLEPEGENPNQYPFTAMREKIMPAPQDEERYYDEMATAEAEDRRKQRLQLRLNQHAWTVSVTAPDGAEHRAECTSTSGLDRTAILRWASITAGDLVNVLHKQSVTPRESNDAV